MKVLNIDHIAINVSDLEKTKEFYRDIMGLDECGFIHMGDHTLTYFQLTANCRLELIHYLESKQIAHVSETDLNMYRHLCLETNDLEALFCICKKYQIQIRKEPSYVEKLSCKNMLIVDPNGVELEIIEK